MTDSTVKTCSVCGEDVSRAKRTKDQWGNYYCGGCLNKRRVKALSGSAQRREASPESIGPTANKRAPLRRGKAGHDEQFPWFQSKGSFIALLLIIGASITCAGLYFGVYRDRWENTNGRTISALKSEADSLSQQGMLDEAELKYDEALKLVAGHQIRNSTLRNQIADMQTSFSRLTQMIANRQAARGEATRSADLEHEAAATRKAEADRTLADRAEAQQVSLALTEKRSQEEIRAAQAELARQLADIQSTLISGQLEQTFMKCKTLYALHPTDEACVALVGQVSRAIYCSLQFQEDQPLIGHTREVLFVALSQDGTHAASYGLDHTVRFWNLETKATEQKWTIKEAEVTGLAFAPDGKSLILNKGIQRLCRKAHTT